MKYCNAVLRCIISSIYGYKSILNWFVEMWKTRHKKRPRGYTDIFDGVLYAFYRGKRVASRARFRCCSRAFWSFLLRRRRVQADTSRRRSSTGGSTQREHSSSADRDSDTAPTLYIRQSFIIVPQPYCRAGGRKAMLRSVRPSVCPVFSPLGKLADRAIYFACVNFFLFLMSTRSPIIPGCTGPIFAIFEPNDRYLFIDDRSAPLFTIPQGTLPCQTNFGQSWQNDLHSAGWRPKSNRNMAVPIQSYSIAIL